MAIKMKKTASGGNAITMTKEDWIQLGSNKGWISVKAQDNGETKYGLPWSCRICGLKAPKESFLQYGSPECPNCGAVYINQPKV